MGVLEKPEKESMKCLSESKSQSIECMVPYTKQEIPTPSGSPDKVKITLGTPPGYSRVPRGPTSVHTDVVWTTLHQAPCRGSAAVLFPMLAYVQLQIPQPARTANVTDDISPGQRLEGPTELKRHGGPAGGSIEFEFNSLRESVLCRHEWCTQGAGWP